MLGLRAKVGSAWIAGRFELPIFELAPLDTSSTPATTNSNSNTSTAMSTPTAPKMTHRFLGESGLLVSKLSLGSWMDYSADYTVDGWYEIVKTAYKHGVNFFDTAEFYGNGQGEELLGGAIKKGIAEGLFTREDLVVTTKIFAGTGGFIESGPNAQGNSRKHLVEGIKASLKRLELEYVDVIYCHRPEKYTPIEETVRAMNFIINQGWSFYWGTSEWSPADIQEARDIADRLGLIRPIVEQSQYNIFERSKVEFQYSNLYKKHKLGLTTWSPLSNGVLTGKYNNSTPEGTRLSNPAFSALVSDFDVKVEKTRQLAPIAARLGCTLAQFSVAWCVSNENVSTVMLGARNAKQLEETIQALAFVDKITPEIKAEVDAIVPFVPTLWEPDMMYTIRERHL
jgi:voltage-dependent potassium channel beta subunit